MEYFVDENSIVREIWGKSDTILFIFAGAAAEFALNKAVDWLYFTGRLPADPLGRLFSTVAYAGKIIFLPYDKAINTIDNINAIHQGVESKRGENIPQWSYRDVLYMLIDYSISAYELLEEKLSEAEKEEVFQVFCRVGKRMQIEALPKSYREWLQDRHKHLENDLAYSKHTADLYLQYKKHLGMLRYHLLLQVQQMVCPAKVKELLSLRQNAVLAPAITAYKLSRIVKMDRMFKSLLLPPEYKKQIWELDRSY